MNSTLPPPGVLPPLPPGSYDTRAPQLLAVYITFGAISTLCVLMRVYTRIKLVSAFATDDALMILAQLLLIGIVIMLGFQTKFGLGTHVWIQPLSYITPSLKLYYASLLFYFTGLSIVKVSICFQLRRIFPQKLIQLSTLGLIIFIVIWTIIEDFLSAFICKPVSFFWNPVNGSCLNFKAVYYSLAAVNIVTDFALFSLPISVIRSVNLPKRQKYLLYIIFGLGFFTCCVSIVRLRMLIIGDGSMDPSWDGVPVTNWTFIEFATAVITACLPTLRPLIMKILPSALGPTTVDSSTSEAKTNFKSSSKKNSKNSQNSDPYADGDVKKGDMFTNLESGVVKMPEPEHEPA